MISEPIDKGVFDKLTETYGSNVGAADALGINRRTWFRARRRGGASPFVAEKIRNAAGSPQKKG